MKPLPLFPLPVTFFPGFPIQLNVFEDRYKEMLGDCMNKDGNFGVVLIQEGCEALGPLAKPHRVGIVSKITKLKVMFRNQIHLEARGITRFWIFDLDYKRSYLQGKVKIEKVKPSSDLDNRYAQELLPLFNEYMDIVDSRFQREIPFGKLPRDARCLAYLTASFLQIPQLQKQALLEIEETKSLIRKLLKEYKKQIAFVKLIRERLDLGQQQYQLLN